LAPGAEVFVGALHTQAELRLFYKTEIRGEGGVVDMVNDRDWRSVVILELG
jgi:hypothetical protein